MAFAALMGACVWLEPELRWCSRESLVLLVARTVLAPGLAAWIVAELVHLVRPLRLFDRRVRKFSRALLAGLMGGILGATVASLGLAIGVHSTHELVIVSVCGALGAGAALLPVRRIRAGFCIHCGYDLSAQPGPGSAGSGMCPECGALAWQGTGPRQEP